MIQGLATLAVGALLSVAATGAHAEPPPPPPPADSPTEPEDELLPTEPAPEPEPKPEPKPKPTETNSASEAKTPPASAQTDTKAEPDENQKDEPKEPILGKYLDIAGYLQPQFGVTVRPDGRPRDEIQVGAEQTRAGILFFGEPLKRFGYMIHLVIGAQGLIEAITDVETVDQEGDGDVDTVSTQSSRIQGLFVEELTVSFLPVKHDKVNVALKLGQMRIPFTAQHRSQNFLLMFPRRSLPNSLFLSGTDLGALGGVDVLGGRLEMSVGVFNGTGASFRLSNERGALYSGRIDVNPLGPFPFVEGDLERGKFRFGVGTGALYFPTKIFDDSGEPTGTRARDFRASASVRMAVRGFFLQGEFFRRQRTDSLSALPEIGTGAYGQMSYFFPVSPKNRLGMAPITRIGWTAEDQSFDPRRSYFIEAGAALYQGSEKIGPDALRVLAQYTGELRITEDEDAHGALLQVQLRF